MIKTNSKKARENIRAYILDNYNPDGYEDGTPEASAKTIEEVAAVILADVKRVEGWKVARYSRYTWQDAFVEWSQGLPGLLDTLYYYNRSARADLAGILEETPDEANRYEESDAERLLSYLIYRELTKAAPGVL